MPSRTNKEFYRETIGKEYDLVPGVRIGIDRMIGAVAFDPEDEFRFEENMVYLWFDSENKILTAETKNFYLQTPLPSHLDDLDGFAPESYNFVTGLYDRDRPHSSAKSNTLQCVKVITFSILNKPGDLHFEQLDLPVVLKLMDIDLDFSKYDMTYEDQYMALSEESACHHENPDDIYTFEHKYSDAFESNVLMVADSTDTTQKAIYLVCGGKYTEKYTTIRGRRNRDYVAKKIYEFNGNAGLN